MEPKIGQLVKGRINGYGVTNENMTQAIVRDVSEFVTIQIIKHETLEDEAGNYYKVHPKRFFKEFELIGEEPTREEQVKEVYRELIDNKDYESAQHVLRVLAILGIDVEY